MDVAQSEFLALLLEEGLSNQSAASISGPDRPGMVTWQSHDLVTKQQPVSTEGGALVGCQRERVEPSKELIINHPNNPMSFLNTDLPHDANADTVDMGANFFDSMLDTILGSSTTEVGVDGTDTPSDSPTPSLPLVTGCEVAMVSGSAAMDDLFGADLDKLLHPFAESILNPAGGDLDTWDIESMLTAA